MDGLKNQTNLFKIQYVPLETLEKNYNKATKYILRDLLETIQDKDRQNLHFELMSIANKRKAASLFKGT